MQKKVKLVFLGAKMMFLGFVIVVINHIMWNSIVKCKSGLCIVFCFADKILENCRIEFNRAEKYYLSLSDCLTLQTSATLS